MERKSKRTSGNGKAIKLFESMVVAIWIGKITSRNTSCEWIFNVLFDYVWDIVTLAKKPKKETDKILKAIGLNPVRYSIHYSAKEISKAPLMKRMAIYDYSPGTGQATTQFYRFLRTISSGKIDCKRLTAEKLIVLVSSFAFDQAE